MYNFSQSCYNQPIGIKEVTLMAVFVSLDGIVVEVLDVFSSFNRDSEFFLCIAF